MDSITFPPVDERMQLKMCGYPEMIGSGFFLMRDFQLQNERKCKQSNYVGLRCFESFSTS